MQKIKLTINLIDRGDMYATDQTDRSWKKEQNDGYWFSCDNLNYLSEEDVEEVWSNHV